MNTGLAAIVGVAALLFISTQGSTFEISSIYDFPLSVKKYFLWEYPWAKHAGIIGRYKQCT